MAPPITINLAAFTKEQLKDYRYKRHLIYQTKYPERLMWKAARDRAKRKGLEFTILESDIVIPEYCPVLGIKLILHSASDASASLDRIDNSRGYTKDNIAVISNLANAIKNKATLSQVRAVANYMEKYIDNSSGDR